jgi:AraC family transcriptional regulator
MMRILKPGCGFESLARPTHVGDFIIVDAFLPAGLRVPRHMHERAYLSLIYEGGFEENYERESLTAATGTVIFDPGSTVHRTVSAGAHILRMELSPTAMALTRELGPTLSRPAVFTQSPVVKLARRVLAEVRSEPHGWRLMTEGLIMEIIGQTVRQERRLKGRAPLWLRTVKDRLDAECERPLSLATLAREASVHPVHLARAFRTAYGSSVGSYQRVRQIRRAEHLLTESGQPLCDIALKCGFADQSHFSKAFRKAVGLAPGQYRRLHSRHFANRRIPDDLQD